MGLDTAVRNLVREGIREEIRAAVRAELGLDPPHSSSREPEVKSPAATDRAARSRGRDEPSRGGLAATLATSAGLVGHAVAAALGHTSEKVTYGHYVSREAVHSARQNRGLQVVAGGQR